MRRFFYDYDFGDGWEHDVVVEDITSWPYGLKHAVCVDGERACPPSGLGPAIADSRLILFWVAKGRGYGGVVRGARRWERGTTYCSCVREIAERLWALVGGDESMLDRLHLHGVRRALPAVFDVTGRGTASIGQPVQIALAGGAAPGTGQVLIGAPSAPIATVTVPVMPSI